jgi:hypothetical protein
LSEDFFAYLLTSHPVVEEMRDVDDHAMDSAE